MPARTRPAADPIAAIVDAAWYASRYGDVAEADAARHFVAHGLAEGRDPNPFFDGVWYQREYPDAAGVLALLHYMQSGAAKLRDPHPRFDAAWYVGRHPQARGNPLLYHLATGAARRWPTEPAPDFSAFGCAASPPPAVLTVMADRPNDRGDTDGLVLRATSRGLVLSLPARPPLRLPPERIGDLVRVLKDMAVARLHIVGMPAEQLDLRALVRGLGVKFDLTVRDYLPVCPQGNLRRRPGGKYCGEPGPSGCNACIAARPSHGATDILTWRHGHAWLFREAARILCPSPQMPARLKRYLGVRARHVSGLLDLRRSGRVSVIVVPERFENGTPTPCGYIRLLQPLDHLAAGGSIDLVLADPDEALRYRADVIATQRYALVDEAAADALAAHCRAQGIRLLYDLDDDLLNIPRDHPEAAMLRPQVRLVARMLGHADAVWVSTEVLAQVLGAAGRAARVVANGLDERLWAAPPAPIRASAGVVRILYMGTATHDADFAVVESALARLHAEFAGLVQLDLIGVTARGGLPGWINRIAPPAHAVASYPGFVDWIVGQRWDIGIAPLADTGFNACKSAIKTLDYAAIGLAVLASDVPAYRGSLAQLVGNTEAEWFAALARLIREPRLRLAQARAARDDFLRTGTLAAQTGARQAALKISPSRRAPGLA